MKASKFLFTLLGIIVFFSSCKKDSNDNSSNSKNIIFSSKFDTQNDLSVWSQSSGGQAIIDSSAVKFTNITNCFHFETVNLIPVQSGKSYELHLRGKVNESIQAPLVVPIKNSIFTEAEDSASNENDFCVQEG